MKNEFPKLKMPDLYYCISCRDLLMDEETERQCLAAGMVFVRAWSTECQKWGVEHVWMGTGELGCYIHKRDLARVNQMLAESRQVKAAKDAAVQADTAAVD